ncbi:MAG: arylsulfatase A-like enzyme [Pirellulaceae bacterium]|jgi:arylsulfatase A-like enzyme
MKSLLSIAVALVLCFGLHSSAIAERPNVLVILVDDLGFSDVGCYGSEIATPNLDRLGSEGLRYTQFHNTGRCWPTRASVLTGYYPHQVRRDAIPGVASGGRGTRPEWAELLPSMLAPAGYRSYHSGKWHVDSMPIATGFHRSYYLRDQGRFFSPQVHFKDDKKLPVVERGSGFYGTTAIADSCIEFLQQHQKEHGDKPFFQYLAFTAPHFPLHALPEDIAKYKDVYRLGWEKTRNARWAKQLDSGIAKGKLSEFEEEIGPPYHFPDALKILGDGEVNRPVEWSALTEQQQQFQAMKMAVHAAMIDRIDQEIGRVLKQLKRMNAMENTLIMFFSDNGASAEIMVRGDGHDANAAAGSAGSYLCLGPGFSTASNTPFRRHKTWVHEGGIATPLIVHWPLGLQKTGQLRSAPGHAIDLVPTILQVAGIKRELGINTPQFPGRSLVPTFSDDVTIDRDSLWWLHEGNRALRAGNWKLVAAKGDPWELYEMEKDPSETNNLAMQHPGQVAEMAKQWEEQYQRYQEDAKRDLKK